MKTHKLPKILLSALIVLSIFSCKGNSELFLDDETNEYSITFNANGGTGDAPGSRTGKAGTYTRTGTSPDYIWSK